MKFDTGALDSLLAAIVESSDDAIVSKDLHGIITSWNKGAEQIFGYTAEEAIGQPIALIAVPERMDEMPAILERIRRGERVDHYETIRRRKDGQRVNISLTVSPIHDDTGRIIGASKIARDITERKLAEEALVKQAERLARANADLQEFAYVTYHDLQEPLRTVCACTEMFLAKSNEKLDEKQRELLGLVLKGGQRMTAMVSELLNYVRTLPEEMPLTNVPAAETVEWACNNLHLAIQTSNAEISYDRDALPVVRGNKIALVQLFQNLLSNAIKYRSSEPPRIAISARRQDGKWFFSVRDNGIGISPVYHKRVFAIFQRLHASQYPGTGIGLALCRKIVQAHGGEIWVESDEGQGATFIFSLPSAEE